MNQPRFLNEELIYSYCRLVKFAENFRETGGERRQPTIPQELPLTSLPQSDRYREPFPTAQSRQPVIELTFSITAELFWPPTSIFGQASTEHAYLWHFFIHWPILSCLHCVCAPFDLLHTPLRSDFIDLLWCHMSHNSLILRSLSIWSNVEHYSQSRFAGCCDVDVSLSTVSYTCVLTDS